MSKILCACLRRPSSAESSELRRRISAGASRIHPRGVRLEPPRIVARDRIVSAIFNPSITNRVSGSSVAVGCLPARSHWSVVGTPPPEGSYAIFRSDGRTLELVSDAVGSRTLWYYMDESLFVASTSQRWLACAIGSFQPNEEALTWMLVTGSLGPAQAWDSRVQRLQPDCTLSLDTGKWQTRLARADNTFAVSPGGAAAKREQLHGTLLGTFNDLDFDGSQWVLPLSGGYDSRAILCMLPRREAMKTITWGTKASMANPASDAAVARRLASSLGASHEYFHTDLTMGSLAGVLEEFVDYGEGRVDHISGYLDGFAIWKTLARRRFAGIIRGDEGFGWLPVSSYDEARRSVGLMLWSDFGNLPNLEEVGLVPQAIPGDLHHRHGETPAQWRDRLYHEFRIPIILAALTDLKASFVEVANPLLSHSIVRLVRTLPDRMRTDKSLFREIVDEIGPPLPYATEMAIADSRSVLRTKEASELFLDTLGSNATRGIFHPLLLNCISGRIAIGSSAGGGGASRKRRAGLVGWIPQPVKLALRRFKRHWPMDFNVMALRVCIIGMTRELLEADAGLARTQRYDEIPVRDTSDD